MNLELGVVYLLHCVLLLSLLCIRGNGIFASGELMCKGDEREALLRFKQGFSDSIGYLSSWGREEDKKECCKWAGVTCSNQTNNVIGLQLSGPEYIGPSRLDGLHYLIHLDLSHINFRGNGIPSFIGSLKNLTYLNLHLSNLFGMVPYNLGDLTKLRHLDLSINNLNSKNLNWLSKLTSLLYLDLTENEFEGSVPDLQTSLSLRELNLGGNKLTNLPSTIGQLRELQLLDVSKNSLQGHISEAHFSQLNNLKLLDLSYNSLQGTITESQFSKLNNLIFLDISFNSLEGIISNNHFSQLQKLEYLDLSFNSLILNLSYDWNPNFQLDIIALSNCSIGPDFPAWLKTQSNFSTLDLSSNGIANEVPNWLWDCSSRMGYLNLSNNHIGGKIHDLSSSFTGSPRIDISSNYLSGELPLFHPNSTILQLSNNMLSGSIQSICRVKYDMLKILDLSSNQFRGVLPNCWENMTELFVLDLENNAFSGCLPLSFGLLSKLQVLNIQDNNLTGTLPSTMKNCTSLKLINGGANKLTGNIPTWMGTLTNMAFLILRHNNFHGRIPQELCYQTLIQVLDLSVNNLEGEIPHCFNNFSSLVNHSESETTVISINPNKEFDGSLFFNKELEYTENVMVKWKRQDFEYKRLLSLLKLIDLSSNNLVGSVPPEIYDLKVLVSLNLSQNCLTGHISSGIGRMGKLDSLDLSRNQLTGEIPLGLAELHFLSVLDLSDNNLWGKIPMGPQLRTFDADTYGGNNDLCGGPLPKCPEENHDPNNGKHGDSSDEKDIYFLSLAFLHEYYISITFGYIAGFWGIVAPLLYFGLLNKIMNRLYVTIALSSRR